MFLLNSIGLILGLGFSALGLIILIITLYFILYNYKFSNYPSKTINIDASGRKVNDYFECKQIIQEYINHHANDMDIYLSNYSSKFSQWYSEEEQKIKNSHLLKKRKNNYLNLLANDHNIKKCNAVCFNLYRKQTRYRQNNYIRESYRINVLEKTIFFNFENFNYLFRRLREINFSTTLEKYHSVNQRKLMTKKLREKIMVRDNYTCQICGVYMPDERGLEIDHIVPVSKGGKTIPDNLQVLCSECNRRKSNKVETL